LSSSSNIIWTIKLRRMRWKKPAASMGQFICAPQNFGPNSMNGRDHLEDLGVDGILKCIKNGLICEDRAGFIYHKNYWGAHMIMNSRVR
jgi:hypothetical protein